MKRVSRSLLLAALTLATFAIRAGAQDNSLTIYQTGRGIYPYEFAGQALAHGAVGGNDQRPDLLVGAAHLGLPTVQCEFPPCPFPSAPGHVYVFFGGYPRSTEFNMSDANATLSGRLGEMFG